MIKSVFYKSDEIKRIEEECFKNGMPVAALMEKASLKSAALFKTIYPQNKYLNVGVFVGPGHNGGDALVIARELFLSGYNTKIYLADDKLKKLTSEQLSYYIFLEGKILDKLEDIHEMDVIIDGLFGLGLKKTLEQKYISIIEAINGSNKNVVSLDLPTGMHADFGIAMGACVKSTHTFCLGFYKYGLIQDHAVAHVGKLHFIDLGLDKIVQKKMTPIAELNRKTIHSLTGQYKPKRNLNKYTNGVCLLFVGSNQYPGAGILSVKGALASGAGYIQLACTDEIKYSITSKIPDVICHNFSMALNQISKFILNQNFSILCGSGLDNDDFLEQIIIKINSLNSCYPCLIIDASSLNAKNYELIKKYKGKKILTPHMGEFQKIFPQIYGKMIKMNSNLISAQPLDKIDAVKMAAKEINGTVLLKGPHTVIANEIGEIFVDIKSTSALARAGCGDVLAGLIAGLNAKGYSPLASACLSVFTQSRTAIRLEKKYGASYVSASHLVKRLKIA